MPAHPLRSGDLARLTGVSADTIRHHEKLGILSKPHRTESGYRLFSSDAIDRVRLAQRALQLGFSLVEISEIFRTHDNGGVPCHRVLHLTQEKLRALGKQIQDLQRTQSYMRELVREWRRKLKVTQPGNRALQLHSLLDVPKRSSSSRVLKGRPNQ